MSPVEEIHQHWSLLRMCERLGISLPDREGVKFCSPFRPDKHASCSVIEGKIRDWTTGENIDSITAFAMARNITNAEAIKQLAAELHHGTRWAPSATQVKPSEHKLVLPELHYDRNLGSQLASLRKCCSMGPDFAGLLLGCLGFGTLCGFVCWVILDAAGRIAEARRLDGHPFPPVGSLCERKAHTLRGSTKSWPLGIMPPKGKGFPPDLMAVMIEGGPDYIVACGLLAYAENAFLPVTMLGAGAAISPDALPLFCGRKVLILAHPGEAGLAAGKRWANQLHNAGATPEHRQLEGGDLNDLVAKHGTEAVARDLGL